MEHIDDPRDADCTFVVMGKSCLHFAMSGLTLCGLDGYDMAHACATDGEVCKRCERSAAKRLRA